MATCVSPDPLTDLSPLSLANNAQWFATSTLSTDCIAQVQQSPFCTAPNLVFLAQSTNTPSIQTAINLCGCPNGFAYQDAANISNMPALGNAFITDVFLSPSFSTLQPQCIVALQSSPVCTTDALETVATTSPWAAWGQQWCSNFVPPTNSTASTSDINEVATGIGYSSGWWSGNATVPSVQQNLYSGLQQSSFCQNVGTTWWGTLNAGVSDAAYFNNVITASAACLGANTSVAPIDASDQYSNLVTLLTTVNGVCSLQKAVLASQPFADTLDVNCEGGTTFAQCGFEVASGTNCGLDTEQSLGVWSYTDDVLQQRCSAIFANPNNVDACVTAFGTVRENIITTVNACCARRKLKVYAIVLAVLIPVLILALLFWAFYRAYKCNVVGQCPRLDKLKFWQSAPALPVSVAPADVLPGSAPT
jgi:hypothetical protein